MKERQTKDDRILIEELKLCEVNHPSYTCIRPGSNGGVRGVPPILVEQQYK